MTLTHLGSTVVAKGQLLAEQDPVGTIGPSGTPEQDVPYVHLGIRVTTDPDGYLDPSASCRLPPPGAVPTIRLRRNRVPAGQRPRVLLPSRRRPLRPGEGLRLRPPKATSHTMRTAVPSSLARRSRRVPRCNDRRCVQCGPLQLRRIPCSRNPVTSPSRRASCDGRLSRRRLPSSRLLSTPATSCGRVVPVAPPDVHRAAATSPQRRRCTDRGRRSAPHRLWPTSPLDGPHVSIAASAAEELRPASRAA